MYDSIDTKNLQAHASQRMEGADVVQEATPGVQPKKKQKKAHTLREEIFAGTKFGGFDKKTPN